ncbi:uncharacterized protein FIBRA_01885 [Fibroporia radiculosa]|uniref:RRM domain-containing protein n=1 Tax=Fibroporia radiculosa TaxID=599839 RepID=J4GLP5_9APHY|nr:uncharacterized protein FIBRA_01885 [Fibroporia radiculosa]CCL99860.1 predicted protein [Fibroporia radiculosa]
MDCSPVSFPSLSLQPDEAQCTDIRPPLPPRIHSTPSLPSLWHVSLPLQSICTSLNVPPTFDREQAHASAPSSLAHRFQARYRPQLRPLDLAASPETTPPRAKLASSGQRSASGSPCRQPSLLTPPLTPSSSFNSATHDGPSTPSEVHSSLRWMHVADGIGFPGSPALTDSPTALKGHQPLPQGGYLTPSSARSQSISSDTDSGYATSPAGSVLDPVSALVKNISSVDITPRDEDANLGSQGLPFDDLNTISGLYPGGDQSDSNASHFLLIQNVPVDTPGAKLKAIFAPMGDIKGIWVRFQSSHRIVILAFYNVRHAIRAKRQIAGQVLRGLDDVRLDAGFVNAERLEMIAGKSNFIDETDGKVTVSVGDRRFESANLQKLLSSFGDLMTFGADTHESMFHAEYYDVRDAENAYRTLNGRNFMGCLLRLFIKNDAPSQRTPSHSDDPFHSTGGARSAEYQVSDHLTENPNPDQQEQSERDTRCMEGRIRPRSVSASENMGAPDAVRRACRGRESPLEHSRRSSNDLFFDAVRKTSSTPQTPSRPRSISIGPDELAGTARLQRPEFIPAPAYPHSYVDSSSLYVPPEYTYVHQTPYSAMPGAYANTAVDAGANSQWTFAAPPVPTIEYCLPPSPRTMYHLSAQKKPSHSEYQRQSSSPTDTDEYDQTYTTAPRVCVRRPSTSQEASFDGAERRLHANPGGTPHVISEKNQLNVEAIEQGNDMRTTVMIKNIPNKMSDRDLLAFIGKDGLPERRVTSDVVCCNVGYAFVNFITVGDLLQFAKTQLGVKWNMYSSEKVLQMCYATYQGKEALVEKFKNSCIMDEREAWRPKIFFSDGSNQGLPEPFPPPTHLRRKERSSHNRGALFVPGAHYQQRHDGSTLYHHRPSPPRMSGRNVRSDCK